MAPWCFCVAAGNPNPPKVDGELEAKGNSVKVSWLKQDDGGSPILHYLIRYKPVSMKTAPGVNIYTLTVIPVSLKLQSPEWKPEIRMPSNSEYVILRGLEWDTEYSIHVVAENEKGKSEPGTMSFRTSIQPEAIPGTLPQPLHTTPELTSR